MVQSTQQKKGGPIYIVYTNSIFGTAFKENSLETVQITTWIQALFFTETPLKIVHAQMTCHVGDKISKVMHSIYNIHILLFETGFFGPWLTS